MMYEPYLPANGAKTVEIGLFYQVLVIFVSSQSIEYPADRGMQS